MMVFWQKGVKSASNEDFYKSEVPGEQKL